MPNPILLSSTPANPYRYQRRLTREVMVGSVGVGGKNPLRVQSMTTTDTMDTDGTVKQILRLAEVGCEIGRITAPTVLDAQNLEKIKTKLIKAGCHMPLVADIHFRPDAAMIAADFVEKVRINPGNFVDGKMFRIREYTDDQYADELKRIEDKFTPLVLKLKRLKRAMRIGTNHGSLSDRIMNRYGDTAEGMVESALEYARICEKNGFYDIIFSMKASNPRVMIAAYRLLVKRMDEENMSYPLHLGVTEAGDGPDGRIKSAAGIGSLLEDGIGDTIRVSLTEDPWFEIPVAQEIARRYNNFSAPSNSGATATDPISYVDKLLLPDRQATDPISVGPLALGGSSPVRIVSRVDLEKTSGADVLALLESRLKRDTPPEILWLSYTGADFETRYQEFRETLRSETQRLGFWVEFSEGQVPAEIRWNADGFVYRFDGNVDDNEWLRLMELCRAHSASLVLLSDSPEAVIKAVNRLRTGRVPLVLGLVGEGTRTVHAHRWLVAQLRKMGSRYPVLLHWDGADQELDIASTLGSLVCDGIGDALAVGAERLSDRTLDFSYNLLQACGSRITKTEFVSCPSCGRTLFDLQSTTERIKSKTGHLKGVKIAIMGCIVNGPGEMADADFGYVGGGPGKINLYVGKDCVEKSIPADIADEKLIELIKSHGKWAEPS